MNKQLAVQTKEQLLEILDWCNNSNRKVALECVGEIAEQILQDMNEYLAAEEKEEQQCFTSDCEPTNTETLEKE